MVDRVYVEKAECRPPGCPPDEDAVELGRVQPRRGLRVPVARVPLVRRIEGHRGGSEHEHRIAAARHAVDGCSAARVTGEGANLHDGRESGIERARMKEGAGIGRERGQEEEVRVAVVRAVRDQVRRALARRRLQDPLVFTPDGQDRNRGDNERQTLHRTAPVCAV